MTAAIAARRAAERWFLDRGLPSVITHRARLRAVWSRSAPALAGYACVSVCLLVIFLLTGRTTINIDGEPTGVEQIVLAIIALTPPLAGLVGWLVARMVTNRAQSIASMVAVATAVVSDAISDGMFGLLATALTVLVVLALTASGLGSVIGWAVRLTLSQLAAAGTLLIRALPVVLLSVLVFFNTYVWIMSATISWDRLWLALGFLVVIAAVFVVTGTIERARPMLQSATASARHAERLAGTPFEEMAEPAEADSLTRGERFNVVFVLAATQIAQILTVAWVTAAIFFVLGLILLSPELLGEWTRNGSSDGTLLGMTIPVPQALMHVTLFLAALTFMYVSARAVGDGEYRSQFLDPLIDDLN
ncbi:MAG: hypothetical protein QOH91_4209 [Mycobacterium sp.]|nr:hypothetical protein [Mycobacterium sp.]